MSRSSNPDPAPSAHIIALKISCDYLDPTQIQEKMDVDTVMQCKVKIDSLRIGRGGIQNKYRKIRTNNYTCFTVPVSDSSDEGGDSELDESLLKLALTDFTSIGSSLGSSANVGSEMKLGKGRDSGRDSVCLGSVDTLGGGTGGILVQPLQVGELGCEKEHDSGMGRNNPCAGIDLLLLSTDSLPGSHILYSPIHFTSSGRNGCTTVDTQHLYGSSGTATVPFLWWVKLLPIHVELVPVCWTHVLELVLPWKIGIPERRISWSGQWLNLSLKLTPDGKRLNKLLSTVKTSKTNVINVATLEPLQRKRLSHTSDDRFKGPFVSVLDKFRKSEFTTSKRIRTFAFDFLSFRRVSTRP
ncbi:unnamed protein product [Acanthoscelides obtectus]|uniref:Uncharacterized protein n=1 Tax=Acanthoscelides obtectus TaxID=200917 RepID=A0A9P0M4C9_ACAOB|nr:unnamed protein product [Acanthoscelides obtectus]CAK1660992.1 hypothetical protein AOBTE_LOCUS22379 [Acanthoscelides obtectus]